MDPIVLDARGRLPVRTRVLAFKTDDGGVLKVPDQRRSGSWRLVFTSDGLPGRPSRAVVAQKVRGYKLDCAACQRPGRAQLFRASTRDDLTAYFTKCRRCGHTGHLRSFPPR